MNIKREYPSKPLVGVGAVIQQGDSILLIKRRFEPSKGKWSIPGGLVEVGETLREALRREVEEEVGLEVEVGDVIDVLDNIIHDEKGRARFHYVLVDFYASPFGGEVRGSKEVQEVRWFTAEEAKGVEMTVTAGKLLKKIGFLSE